jgi:NTE family protein
LARHFRPTPGVATGLVDTTPLEETIDRLIKPSNFGKAVGSNGLETVGIVASACSTMKAVVFLEGGLVPQSTSTDQVRYVGTELGPKHLLASSAFPMVFPPIWVPDPDIGGDWYIDGGVHLNTPFKPAIDLGADRILVVGGTQLGSLVPPSPDKYPALGDSNGQILHALLADGFEADLAHLRADNTYVEALQRASAVALPDAEKEPLAHRTIKYLKVGPSSSTLDDEAAKICPAGWLNLLTSLGGYKLLGPVTGQRQRPGQFLSYLCFDERFIAKAIELGQADAKKAVQGLNRVPWVKPVNSPAPAQG